MKKMNKTASLGGLIASMALLVMYVSVFIGGTYAYFSDNQTSKNNTIVSGTLEMELMLKDGSDHTIDHTNGTSTVRNVSSHDFSDSDETALIDLANIQPGDWGERNLAISNKGSVAFTNMFEITAVATDTAKTDVDDYLVVKVFVAGVEVVADSNGQYDLGVCAAAGTVNFSIYYEMKNVNNDYQGVSCEITFDLVCDQIVTDAKV